MKDLIVLVADSQQKMVIETLLEKRYQSLKIRQLKKGENFDVFSHPNLDPGVYYEGANFLSGFVNKYKYALVILDAEWEGTPGKEQIKNKIQQELNKQEWNNKSYTIVIDPELEIWVWSSSPEVYNILGQSEEQVRQLGEQKKFWIGNTIKPQSPKDLMNSVLRQAGKRPSAAIFKSITEKVSLKRCEDTAFIELKEKLQQWLT